MKTSENDKMRTFVRKKYGEVAEQHCAKTITPSSCCATAGAVTQIAPQMLGYTQNEMRSIPEAANLGLGCGNPLAFANVQAGEVVLDLGSGAGIDCFLVAQQVGENGCVIGVDMTPAMVARATANAQEHHCTNVEFRLGEIEDLPVASETIDVILSNCVINLSTDKPRVYSEMFRVLKPGGRIAISDIVAKTQIPAELTSDVHLFSC